MSVTITVTEEQASDLVSAVAVAIEVAYRQRDREAHSRFSSLKDELSFQFRQQGGSIVHGSMW